MNRVDGKRRPGMNWKPPADSVLKGGKGTPASKEDDHEVGTISTNNGTESPWVPLMAIIGQLLDFWTGKIAYGYGVIQELAHFLTGRDGTDCFLPAPEFHSLA